MRLNAWHEKAVRRDPEYALAALRLRDEEITRLEQQVGGGVMDLSLMVVIGSALVHADELLDTLADGDSDALQFDMIALRDCLDNPALAEWLQSLPMGLLPVKRERKL